MTLSDVYTQLPLLGSEGTRITGDWRNPYPLTAEYKEAMRVLYWLSLNWGDEGSFLASGNGARMFSGFQTRVYSETEGKPVTFWGHTHLRHSLLDDSWWIPSPNDANYLRERDYITARPRKDLPAAGFIKWGLEDGQYTVYFADDYLDSGKFFSPWLPREYYLRPTIIEHAFEPEMARVLPSLTLLRNYLPESDLRNHPESPPDH
jgi:hypothetical protein